MKVLVIGAGNMGAALVKQLHNAGHSISLFSRNAEKAHVLASRHIGVRISEAGLAAEGQDLVALATGFGDAITALRSAGVKPGQIVLDVTNPLTPDYMGLTIGHTTSAAEEIALALPGVHVVKGFNTLFAQVLEAGPDAGQGRKASVFLASDSDGAKQTARALAQSLGFDVVDAGGLKNARYLEPLAGLNIYLGYGAGLGTAISPTWMHHS